MGLIATYCFLCLLRNVKEVPFWEKLGFYDVKTEQLTWANKTSVAVVMRKNIQG